MTTNLSVEELADLRRRAQRDGGFVNPRLLTQYGAKLATVPASWAETVLGRPFEGPRRDTWVACLTLIYALEVEPDPQPSPAELAAAEAARARLVAETEQHAQHAATRLQAWAELRRRLPVQVVVLYNYSGPHHQEWYTSGADHIVLEEPLTVGRLHRAAGDALCSTPARRRRQDFSDVRLAGDQARVPTCRECLRVAARLTGDEQATALAGLLAQYSRRAPGGGRP